VKREDLENSNLSGTQGVWKWFNSCITCCGLQCWDPFMRQALKACCTQVKSYLGCLYLVLFSMLSFFLQLRIIWLSNTSYILQQKKGHSEPASTTSAPSTGCHWMPITTWLWMNLIWVNIWFHLGNQFCRKYRYRM
jgi:hypothetical protein